MSQNYVNSPNMGLIIPTVGLESGPEYATDINNTLLIVDQHDHSLGSGVQITPAGINVDRSFQFNNNFAVAVAGVSLQPQASVSLSDTIYVKGSDLYFINGLGQEIRITANNAVAGSAGNIANLSSPASAAFITNDGKFKFERDSSIAADIDGGAFLFRNTTPNSTFAITLRPPSALSSNYNITLPTLPSPVQGQSFMTLDSAGVMSAPWTVDGSTIRIISNQLAVQGGAIPNSEREHAWELNGVYGALTYPLLNLDSMFIAPYDLQITSVWIYSTAPGSGGTTEFDLKLGSIPGTDWTSILSTTGKIDSTSAFNVFTITGVSGTYSVGETVKDLTSLATAVVYSVSSVGTTTTLTVNQVSGTFGLTNTVKGLTSLATGALSTISKNYPIWTDSGSVVPALSGVTKPVLSTSTMLAGQAIRWDLLSAMTGSPVDARIKIFYKQL